MLSNEERKLLVDAHEKGYQTKDLAEIFKISVNSVNRIIRQKKRTGSCELKTHNCGRKSILTETDFKHISELITTDKCYLTIINFRQKIKVYLFTKPLYLIVAL